MLYSATHHTYSATNGHDVGETRTFGSLKAARMWAASVLPPSVQVSDENYWSDLGRCSTVDITSSATKVVESYDGETYTVPDFRTTVYPRIDVVPSVGQLGYW
jgi:hypothetical protein